MMQTHAFFFDLNSKRADKKDAKHAFILTAMTIQAYKKEYNDDPATWPKPISESYFDWSSSSGHDVYVAEYYEVEETKETVYTYKHIDDEIETFTETDFKNDEELKESLKAMGSVIESEKRIKKQKVHKYIMSGGGILKDSGLIAGKYIPICMFFAERDIIDGVERAYGIPRYACDSQRLTNMMRSRLAEMASLSALEKPIFSPEQIVGHENQWADDNVKNDPFLLINQTIGPDGEIMPTGPLNYTKVPQIPPALAATMQIADMDTKELLGDHAATEKILSGVSGIATEKAQNQFDMQSFIYTSNFRKTMKMCGDIWIHKAPDLYIEPNRKMKAVRRSGDSEDVMIKTPMIDDNGELFFENDLSKAVINVVATVSPSTSSKKSAMVSDLLNLLNYTEDPQDRAVITAQIIMNMTEKDSKQRKNTIGRNLSA